MKERADILDRAAALRAQARPFALATVVKIDGSTYRRPGARMLVVPPTSANGPGANADYSDAAPETLGTISGGCLEGEVARRALQTLATGQPRVEDFDLADDDLILGFGIGCDGAVRVLIEPLLPEDRTAPDPLRLIAACHAERRHGVLATVIGAPRGAGVLGRHALLGRTPAAAGEDRDAPGDAPAETLGVPGLAKAIRRDARTTLNEGRTHIRRYEHPDGTFEVLFEAIAPPVRLLVFGDGHDARPVVRTAAGLGWTVTVVGEERPEKLADRFPDADEHVFLMHPEASPERLGLSPAAGARTAAVVMNHQYERDKALIGALLPTHVAYVGALGPRERTEAIVGALREGGHALPEDMTNKLHGPAGLDLGTETPEEIALAIVAEVQATLSGRSAQKLREREGHIHERVPATHGTG